MSVTFLTNEDEQRIILESEKESLKQLTSMLFQHEEQMASVRISANPDIHAEYFQITDGGVLSLKDVYRGAALKDNYGDAVSNNGVGVAGSQNAELPKHLIVPEIVDGKAVVSLAPAIFRYNQALESVTFPSTITTIPDCCFDNSLYLKSVYNTEGIKNIGQAAFQKAGVIRLNFPNLEQLGNAPFIMCSQLVYADIGKVEVVAPSAFNSCFKLNMVKSENAIAEIGSKGFYRTFNLKHADLTELKKIGGKAFLRSGVDCDWAALEANGCDFGEDSDYATPLQYNPTDYWSACTFTPCKNPLPTHLSQMNEAWKDVEIGGTSQYVYNEGCLFFSIMHIYCGLHNLSLQGVDEMVDIINGIDPDWIEAFARSGADIKSQAEDLGLQVDLYASFNQSTLQDLYDALAAGKYAIFAYDEPNEAQHLVVVYGINAKGELLVADSETSNYANGCREPLKYALPISKLADQASTGYALHIVSLKEE